MGLYFLSELLNSIDTVWLLVILLIAIALAFVTFAVHRRPVEQVSTSPNVDLTPEESQEIRQSFFTATFSVMGHIAKADGHVQASQIALAENVIKDMSLNARQRASAIELFNQGKRANFKLKKQIRRFREECANNRSLYEDFLEIQIKAALADGKIAREEEVILLLIAKVLDISSKQYKQLEVLARVSLGLGDDHSQRFKRAGAKYSQAKSSVPKFNATTNIKDAYVLLGVDVGADEASVKKAYRKLMNQHHPDKLASTGSPEEVLKIASDKTQAIQKAYEQIKRARAW